MKHVAIVGAGIVGLSIADDLLEKGFRVTIIERETSEGDGCSYGNGGLVVPSHFVPLAAPGMVAMGLRMMADRGSPFGVEKFDLATLSWMARFALAGTKAHVARSGPILKEMNLASRALFERNVGRFAADAGYEQRGIFMLSRTAAAHDGEAHLADDANRIGLRAKVLSADEVRRMEPDVDMEVAGAVWFEDDAHLSPSRYVSALRRHVVAQGATLKTGVEVQAFESEAGVIRAVRTSVGKVEADEFVLAAGSWSSDLAKSVGLRLPMRAGRGYGFTVPNLPQRMKYPTILTEARVAVTPVPDGIRFVGTMELTGPVVRPTSPRVDAMRRNIGQYYPKFTEEKLQAPTWCGLRPCTPDGMPFLGRTGCSKNLVIATGHAMMGFSLGPITGKLVGDLLAGEPSSISLSLLSPDRYV